MIYSLPLRPKYCFVSFRTFSAGPPPRTQVKKRNGPPIHSLSPFLFCAGEGGPGVLLLPYMSCAREGLLLEPKTFFYEKGTGNFIFQNISFSFHIALSSLSLSLVAKSLSFPSIPNMMRVSCVQGRAAAGIFPPCSPHGFVLRGVGGGKSISPFHVMYLWEAEGGKKKIRSVILASFFT